MTFEVTPPRRKRHRSCRRRSSEDSEHGFHLEDKDQAGSIPTKTPLRRTTTPEDATVVDTDTEVGKAFARCFVQYRPND
jgi:hypothetical protein